MVHVGRVHWSDTLWHAGSACMLTVFMVFNSPILAVQEINGKTSSVFHKILQMNLCMLLTNK